STSAVRPTSSVHIRLFQETLRYLTLAQGVGGRRHRVHTHPRFRDGLRWSYKAAAVHRVSFFFQAEDGIRDGHVTGVPTCALPISGRAPPRAFQTPGVLPPRGRRGGGADPRQLPRHGRGRVPHGHGGARRGDHQGQEEGARLARGPGVQLGAGGGAGARAEDRDLARLGSVEREVLARDARVRRRGRGRVPRAVRSGEADRSGALRRRVPPAAEASGMAVGPFREIERSYFDLRWHLDPVAATQAGIKTHDDRYGRFSPGALAPHLAALKALAAALEETASSQLDDE